MSKENKNGLLVHVHSVPKMDKYGQSESFYQYPVTEYLSSITCKDTPIDTRWPAQHKPHLICPVAWKETFSKVCQNTEMYGCHLCEFDRYYRNIIRLHREARRTLCLLHVFDWVAKWYKSTLMPYTAGGIYLVNV